ncbi:MAG: M23 family metallopeptidase, partial [Bacteroidota bacterium]
LVNVVAEVEKGNTPPEGRDREGQSSKSRSSNENFTKNVKPVMADSKSVSTSPQKVATNQPKTEPVTSASAATPSPPISAPSATKTNTVARPSRPTNTARSAITRSFTNKRGTMPWPIIKGEISERYGIRLNAETRGLKSRNFGLDFSCPPASSILAVHQGTVLLISESDFEGSTVTLKHGDYLTVYYNLSTVDVRRGDVVAMGQRLGRLATGATDKVFHFEVWEDQHRTNPERWLQTR